MQLIREIRVLIKKTLGLCTAKGCKNKWKVEISIESSQKKRIRYLCKEHAAEVEQILRGSAEWNEREVNKRNLYANN